MKTTTLSISILLLITTFAFWACDKNEEKPVVPYHLHVLKGEDQSAYPGETLKDSIIVLIADKDRVPCPGREVFFSASDGSITATSLLTDENGEAGIEWTLSTTPGEQTLTIESYQLDGSTPLYGVPKVITAKAAELFDCENNGYNIVTIGEQTWMKDNLEVKCFPDGTPIAYNAPGESWYEASSSKPVYSITSETDYVYNWEAAMNGTESSSTNPSDVQGICPTGWHLPSSDEYQELVDYLGGEPSASIKLRKNDPKAWFKLIGSTNESGFSATSIIKVDYYGNTLPNENQAFYWCSDGSSFIIQGDLNNAIFYTGFKTCGYSIRCIKDKE